jgi:hypothetical protein
MRTPICLAAGLVALANAACAQDMARANDPLRDVPVAVHASRPDRVERREVADCDSGTYFVDLVESIDDAGSRQVRLVSVTVPGGTLLQSDFRSIGEVVGDYRWMIATGIFCLPNGAELRFQGWRRSTDQEGSDVIWLGRDGLIGIRR